LNVAILDKQKFPRDKICGGWITPAVLRELEIDQTDYARGRVFQPIESFLVGSIGKTPIETAFSEPVSYGIRRKEFDDYLLRRSGGELLLGTPLTSLERKDGGWIINSAIHAQFLIGAGGHFCPVARFAGSQQPESPVIAQEVEFEMTADHRKGCRVLGEKPELYFCADLKGYGWCFRKGDVLNIGLGRADQHHLPEHVANFVRFLRRAGRISFEIPPLRGHAYLLKGTSPRKISGQGYLLIGDAAGLAALQSGEGILPAVESGLLAAKSILARNFDSYRAQLAPPAESALMKIGHSLPSPVIGFVGRTLLRTNWFVRDVVLKDWFLHHNHAAT
jgi:flavin-dependent dehydrogenase